MEEYITIGKLNSEILNKLNIDYITEEVIFTYERIQHVEDRRKQLYEQVKEILPIAVYNPDYIYKDWNNRDNTLVFIKSIDEKSKLNIIIKIAIAGDEEHSKNSIMTIIKIGEKTFKKICKNKSKDFLYENIDKNE